MVAKSSGPWFGRESSSTAFDHQADGLDGERFVADLVQFRSLDWRARVRLVQ